jgi:hypothetical protein
MKIIQLVLSGSKKHRINDVRPCSAVQVGL